MDRSPRPIIIDTDPGQDDAVALILALASPDELDVLGITTVAGNVPLPLTTRNALAIVELCQRSDVGVFAGCDRPMERPLVTAEHVHGPTGLDGSGLGHPTLEPSKTHAVDFIIAKIQEASPARPVTLCALGPLTNVATALQTAPDIAERIDEIVMMGGGFFEGGNITPAAEFNMYVDPQAAAVVFGSGVPLVLMPLDVTHQALTSPTRIKVFRDLQTQAGMSVAGMLNFSERFDINKYGGIGAPLHDPTVLAYLLDPQLFGGKTCNVEIETSSELTMGMTVVDWWKVTERPENCLVMNTIDDGGFFDLLIKGIGRIG